MASTGLIPQGPTTSYGIIFTIRFTHPAIFDNHNLDYAEIITKRVGEQEASKATLPSLLGTASLLDGKKAVLIWTMLDLRITFQDTSKSFRLSGQL